MRFLIVVLLLLSTPATSVGHHSVAEYDEGVLTVLEGEVVTVLWRNPHVTIEVRVDTSDGSEEIWRTETGPVNLLNRWGVPQGAVKEGDRVRVEGHASSRRARLMEISRLAVGTDIVIGGDIQTEEYSPEEVASSRARAEGIFRAWSWLPAYPSVAWPADLPLTATAENARQNWDPYVHDEAKRCVPPGMPRAMTLNGWPIEFVDEGEEVHLYLEEFDAVRTIHMTRQLPSDQEPATPLGYSIGWWEDEDRTLVVHTTRIDYPWFDRDGIPQSHDVELLERFTLADDDTELGYEITVIDSATFTEPVVGTKRWTWRAGLELQPYDCAYLGEVQ